MLLEAYFKLPKELQVNKNESELWIEVGKGSRIELKGADNEDSLRGSGLNGIVIDEVASIQDFGITWEEVVRPALIDKGGWAIFIGTPKGYNHFYDLWQKGVSGPKRDIDFKSWKFTSYDNPYLKKEEIQKAKESSNEDAFAQEYLADFRKYTGAIYKEFNRNIHVLEPFKIPETWQIYRAMDFGASNPTVCLWIAIDGQGNFYIFDEYYQSNQRIEFHAGIIKAKSKKEPIITWGDPSAEQAMLDYAQYGVIIAPAIKFFTDGNDWVLSGINKVRDALKINPQLGKPKLFIFNNCSNTIKEFEFYRWAENTKQEVPLKETDHCMDALRYFVGSYTKSEESFPDQFVEYNSFTSY